MKNLLTVETISRGGSSQAIEDQDALLCIPMGQPDGHSHFTNGSLCPRLGRKPNPITVLLAESRNLVRHGICSLLAQENGIKVIGQAMNERQAVELADELRPDVAILCGAIASLNGMHAVRHILRTLPFSRVIILGRQGDDAYVKDAAALGAAGYLTEQVSGKMLARAVRAAAQGANVCNAAIFSGCFRERPRLQAAAEDGAAKMAIQQLTARQRQILQLIAEGNANKQTASDLSISIKTVEKHRENLMAKLGIHETAGLTRYAIAAGIVGCDLPTEAKPEMESAGFAFVTEAPAAGLAERRAWRPKTSVNKNRIRF